MRKIIAGLLLLVSIQAMAQVSFGQRPSGMMATQDSIIASFAEKGKWLSLPGGKWDGVANDTTSYFMKSLVLNKAALRISRQAVRRSSRTILPSSRTRFEDPKLKQVRQNDLYWNSNRNTLTGIGNYILDAIFN